jgi:hypothetical protein
MCRSWNIAAVVVFSQIASILFVRLVELPHMEKVYGVGSASAFVTSTCLLFCVAAEVVRVLS